MQLRPLLSLLPLFMWGAKAPLEPQKLFLTSFRESRFEWDFGFGKSRTWTLFCLTFSTFSTSSSW